MNHTIIFGLAIATIGTIGLFSLLIGVKTKEPYVIKINDRL